MIVQFNNTEINMEITDKGLTGIIKVIQGATSDIQAFNNMYQNKYFSDNQKAKLLSDCADMLEKAAEYLPVCEWQRAEFLVEFLRDEASFHGN
jgi:hypothetical protein